MKVLRAAVAAAVVVALAAVAWIGWVGWPRAMAPAQRPSTSSFSPDLVRRGAKLAALGDCATCHTTAGGKDFAGGLAIATPFGTVYSTNITPDASTGVGSLSEAAFRRAMRKGVSGDGHLLYPAFPYDHFTKVDDADLHALYAFVMTRAPIKAPARPNDLRFPFDLRPLMVGWNLLFLDDAPIPADPSKSAEWNHGRYLVEGLAHCGACHTPRNAFGAEKRSAAFSGADTEGWLAPALDGASPEPAPWTADDVFAYLKTGFAARHSFAAGPMGPVVHGARLAPDADVRAIAVYVASLQTPASKARRERSERALALAGKPGLGLVRPEREPADATASLYAASCGSCHFNGDSKGEVFESRQRLGLGLAANAPTPDNLLRVILDGITPPPGRPGAMMPGFSGTLTDAQIIRLAAYVRAHFSDEPPWPDLDGAMAAARRARAAATSTPDSALAVNR